jgi:hypothetical protein
VIFLLRGGGIKVISPKLINAEAAISFNIEASGPTNWIIIKSMKSLFKKLINAIF